MFASNPGKTIVNCMKKSSWNSEYLSFPEGSFSYIFILQEFRLQCIVSGLAGSDADGVSDLVAEDLAVSRVAGEGGFLNSVDNFDLPVFG